MKRIFITLALSLIFLSGFAYADASVEKKTRKVRLYMASALFNGRETQFNLEMAKQFESRGYKVILPQRDGFEYISLRKAVSKTMPKSDLVKVTRELIYLLDMGVFIPQSDIVVANLDEPLDEGVVVELTYARLMGKPVIGYRTDSRTPFGGVDGMGGLHSFVGYQCNDLVRQRIAYHDLKQAQTAIKKLADTIESKIKHFPINDSLQLPSYALNNPAIGNLIQGAHLVFSDVHDLHTEDGLRKTVKNIMKYNKKISSLATSVKVTGDNGSAKA